MNFLIEFSTLTYSLKHGIAKHLSKLYPGSKFVGLVSSHVDTEGYLNKQGGPTYEYLYNSRELPALFLEQEIDYDALREFEASIPEKSLWRYVAMDSVWGDQFVKSAYRKNRYIYSLISNENILRLLSGYLKFYRELLTRYKINVVLPAPGMMGMRCPILEQLCRNLGIHYLVPATLRTLNYMALSPNRLYTYPQIDKTYQDLLAGRVELDLSVGEEIYKKIMASLGTNAYFDKPSIPRVNRYMPWLRLSVHAAKSVISETLRWLREKSIHKDETILNRQTHDLGSLFSNISYAVRKSNQKMKLLDPKFYSEFDANMKYVYLPLQNTPEYSTQVRAPMWVNQLVIIEALAKSIPAGWKLYVREHPGTITTRVRRPSFYREIKGYPNVELIPTYLDNHEVVKNAQLVINTGGTTGWEAVQFGKPVINFADNIYDVMGLSAKCTDIEKLSVVIHDEIRRIGQISAAERKKRMVCLLTAMIKHGFWADDPLKVTDVNCSDEEAVQLGRMIGEKIREYLDEYSKEAVKVKI